MATEEHRKIYAYVLQDLKPKQAVASVVVEDASEAPLPVMCQIQRY